MKSISWAGDCAPPLTLFSKVPASGGTVKHKKDDEMLRDALVEGVVMGIPGLSVAIGSGDSLAWTGTAGYSDILRKVPVKPDDRFCIGSITKTFVARVVLQMVEEGLLDLNQTAADYLNPEILRGVPNSEKATLRQLLNHQSGIPDWEFLEAWIHKGRGDQMVPGKIWNKTETLEYIRNAQIPANHPPGQRYAYANTNYTLLGLVIEAVTGSNAAAEIRRRILEPLCLENTFFESFEEVPGGYVHHYHYATPQFKKAAGIHPGFNEIRPYLVESTIANFSAEWTAGGMVSSASDLARWALAIRRGELLGPAMQKEVFTYYPPEDPQDSEEEYMQGVDRIKNLYKQRAVLGHSGGTLGFTTGMYWLENTDITIVLLTNVGGMHSGLSPSPIGLFYREVLLPAALKYLEQ